MGWWAGVILSSGALLNEVIDVFADKARHQALIADAWKCLVNGE